MAEDDDRYRSFRERGYDNWPEEWGNDFALDLEEEQQQIRSPVRPPAQAIELDLPDLGPPIFNILPEEEEEEEKENLVPYIDNGKADEEYKDWGLFNGETSIFDRLRMQARELAYYNTEIRDRLQIQLNGEYVRRQLAEKMIEKFRANPALACSRVSVNRFVIEYAMQKYGMHRRFGPIFSERKTECDGLTAIRMTGLVRSVPRLTPEALFRLLENIVRLRTPRMRYDGLRLPTMDQINRLEREYMRRIGFNLIKIVPDENQRAAVNAILKEADEDDEGSNDILLPQFAMQIRDLVCAVNDELKHNCLQRDIRSIHNALQINEAYTGYNQQVERFRGDTYVDQNGVVKNYPFAYDERIMLLLNYISSIGDYNTYNRWNADDMFYVRIQTGLQARQMNVNGRRVRPIATKYIARSIHKYLVLNGYTENELPENLHVMIINNLERIIERAMARMTPTAFRYVMQQTNMLAHRAPAGDQNNGYRYELERKFPIDIAHLTFDEPNQADATSLEMQFKELINTFLDDNLRDIMAQPVGARPKVFMNVGWLAYRTYQHKYQPTLEARGFIQMYHTFDISKATIEVRTQFRWLKNLVDALKEHHNQVIEYYKENNMDLEFDTNSIYLRSIRLIVLHQNQDVINQMWARVQNRDQYLNNELVRPARFNVAGTKIRLINANPDEDGELKKVRLRAGCCSTDGYFKEMTIRSALLRAGLCLFEFYYGYFNTEKYIERGSKEKVIGDMLREWDTLDDGLKEIFLSEDVEEMLTYCYHKKGKSPPVYLYYANRFINPDEKCIEGDLYGILKDGHMHLCRYDIKRHGFLNEHRKKFEGIKATKGRIIEKLQPRQDIKNKIRMFIDIETFCPNIITKAYHQPYLIVVGDDSDHFYDFWGLNAKEDFLNWLGGLLDPVIGMKGHKSSQTIEFWSFNGAKFDYIFFVRELIKRYHVEVLGDITNTKRIVCGNLVFMDFRNIFASGSLDKLAQSWKIDYRKTEMDHSKVNIAMIENDENFKKECIEYCRNDVTVLRHLFYKYKDLILGFHKGDQYNKRDNFFSASDLSMNIFQTLYLNPNTHISGVNREYYEEVRSSYYGGITQCLKKIGHNLNYYDINSCYPYIMTDPVPIRMKKRVTVEHVRNITESVYRDDTFEPNSLYQVLEFTFKYETIIPNLPVRTKDGLYYVLESREPSWRWGFELIHGFVHSKLKGVKVKDYYQWKMVKVFSTYIKDIYERRLKAKKEGNTSLSELLKVLMNSLYGKFGQKLYPSVEYVNSKTLVEMCISNEYSDNIRDITQYDDDCYKMIFNDEVYTQQIGSCVFLASYITARARSHLLETISKLKDGDKSVYYMDTDSIITSSTLDEEFLSQETLGKLKLEKGNIQEGIFLGSKMYYLKCKDGSEDYHIKGVKKNALKPEEVRPFFVELMANGEKKITNKATFMRSVDGVKVVDVDKRITIKNRRKFVGFDSLPYFNIKDAQVA
jgi:hypothetical protein